MDKDGADLDLSGVNGVGVVEGKGDFIPPPREGGVGVHPGGRGRGDDAGEGGEEGGEEEGINHQQRGRPRLPVWWYTGRPPGPLYGWACRGRG